MNETKVPRQADNNELITELFDLLYRREWLNTREMHEREDFAGFRRTAMQLARALSRHPSEPPHTAKQAELTQLTTALKSETSALAASGAVPRALAREVFRLLERIEQQT